jgi:hypothetical protein
MCTIFNLKKFILKNQISFVFSLVLGFLTLLSSPALAQAKSGSIPKQMQFLPDNAYTTLSSSSPKAYRGKKSAYVNTGSTTSPGIFKGGLPLPMTIMGSWGPGNLYVWPQYIKTGSKTVSVTRAKNVLGLPNGIAMIHWDSNNLESSLAGKYTVEMVTGWGSYPAKVLPNDYGWINGTIMNLLGRFQAPFIHIYYRKINGKNAQGVEQSTLYFWELLLTEKTMPQAELLYTQLKASIDKYWNTTTGKIYPDYTGKNVPEPLASAMNSVYFMMLPSNQDIPTVPPKYWSANTAYPENNIKG